MQGLMTWWLQHPLFNDKAGKFLASQRALFSTTSEKLNISRKFLTLSKKLTVGFYLTGHQFSSVHFSRSVVSNSLQPHGLQHARPPYPSPFPRARSNPCPMSRWCLPTISSSVIPFSSCLQSFPASGSFQMSQLFASGGQSIGVSASASVLLI